MPPTHVDIAALLAEQENTTRRVRWSSTTQLQANVVWLEPGARIEPHVEAALDVVLVVVAGSGVVSTSTELGAPVTDLAATVPAVVVVTAGTARAITAGPGGMAYVTVHRRRPGLTPTVREQ